MLLLCVKIVFYVYYDYDTFFIELAQLFTLISLVVRIKNCIDHLLTRVRTYFKYFDKLGRLSNDLNNATQSS